jgi:acyl-CoA synthetase (AMP-forming)/AMP-acid ligase II
MPPVAETKEEPLPGNAALAGLSEDEFREALAYAQHLRTRKQNAPKSRGGVTIRRDSVGSISYAEWDRRVKAESDRISRQLGINPDEPDDIVL